MSSNKLTEKIRLQALIEPLNVRLFLSFPINSLICKILHFELKNNSFLNSLS
jgi:hypothetical protein